MATTFCEISTLLLAYVVPVKSKVEISQKFVAFSEYRNFNKKNPWSCSRLIEYDGSVWVLFELYIKVSKYFQFCICCDFFFFLIFQTSLFWVYEALCFYFHFFTFFIQAINFCSLLASTILVFLKSGCLTFFCGKR